VSFSFHPFTSIMEVPLGVPSQIVPILLLTEPCCCVWRPKANTYEFIQKIYLKIRK
jgi:hypothetical protein